jgi:chromosome segregation ATPase
MEREKLEQAKKTFEEDKDKFKKYKEDLEKTTQDVQMEFEKAVSDKNARVAEIKRIEGDIVSKELEIKKIEETVQICKTRKAFLDELAVSAGKKQPWVPGT